MKHFPQNNSQQYPSDYDPYYRVNNTTLHEKPQISLGEPCMVNPSSIETVKTVLEHARHHTRVGSDRSFTVVHSDGAPFVFAAALQDDENLFDDIVLVPGPGHIELNTARLLLSFLWNVYLPYFAKILGFR